MKRLILVMIMLAGPAWANERCASIERDDIRLICYDRAYRTVEPDTTRQVSEWSVETERSEFKDTDDVFLSVTSKHPVQCGRHREPTSLALVVRCFENTTAIYVTGDCHFADHAGYDLVDIRIDDKEAFSQRMSDSTTSKALGHWRGRKAIPLVKRMLGGTTLRWRATPFSSNAFTAQFPIAGLDEAIKPLRESCGW